MKFTLSWLKAYLKYEGSLEDLASAMTMAGLEVEAVENRAEVLQAFTAAKILSAEQHPNADKLQVCQVDTVDGRQEIVCGALNARAGLVTAYAPIGAYVPGLDVTLVKKPVRGVDSNGMLCSGGELEAEEDPFGLREGRIDVWFPRAQALGKTSHDEARADGGILELPDDTQVGASVGALMGLDDPVIDFEVTPNRPDWLGVVGIARDLAACGLGTFKAPKIPAVKTNGEACPIGVEVDPAAGCPAFAGRVIRGVKNGPSPDWMQHRLRSVGISPKNMLVDVTNYLSLDRARPLHVYDVAKLSGTVVARSGRSGERFVALDDKEYAVTGDMCVIADDARVLGLGGVMGGAFSGVSEDTTDVFIESAWFDPDRIARTGRATGITSDAQYRFARGVDPGSLMDGLDAATAMILDVCGGTASEAVFAGEAPAANPQFAFDTAQVERLTGIAARKPKIVSILKKLGIEASGEDEAGRVLVNAPSWRPDIAQSADLVEEVARVVGYDNLPAEPLPRIASGRKIPAMSPARRRVSDVRRTWAGRGLREVITWSFCRADQATLFGAEKPLMLANPISSELTAMRPSVLVHLCLALQKTADRGLDKAAGDAAFFEIGPAYHSAKETGQSTLASLVRKVGATRHWDGAVETDVFTAKADALAALGAAGAPVGKVQVSAGAPGWFHPGRSGVITLGPKVRLAEFGELHPKVLKALGVEGRVVAVEIDLSAIPAPKVKATRTKPALHASELQPLTRDFAFVTETARPARDLVTAAAGADKALIADVRVFDVFEGAALGAGKKSVALEVTLQPKDKTLDDKAIEAVSEAIVTAVAKKTGASLRS